MLRADLLVKPLVDGNSHPAMENPIVAQGFAREGVLSWRWDQHTYVLFQAEEIGPPSPGLDGQLDVQKSRESATDLPGRSDTTVK